MTQDELTGIASMRDATLPEVNFISNARQDSADLTSGSLLYEYSREGKINGIRVSDTDRNLAVDRDDVLGAAMDLHSTPHVEFLVMAGDDGEGIRRYREILERVYSGAATVVSEDRHYDPSRGGFVILLRYDDIEYRLNSRFEYLRSK